MIKPRPHLVAIERTKDELESRLPYLRLEKNERLVPFEEPVLKRFREILTPDIVMAYPELEPLYQKLAQYLKVKRNELYLAAGSDLGIKTVYETYINPGDRIVMHSPGYAMQEIYSRIFQANLVRVPCDAHLQLDVRAFCDMITPGTRMVVMENPNGFTGQSLSLSDVETIVQKAHECQAIALLDEAYYLFSNQTVQSLYQIYDNVIITRTFSKDLGLAGLRCAYLLSQAGNIASLYHVKPMHEINSAAAAFVLASLEFPQTIASYVKEVQESVRYLQKELAGLGIPTIGGAANFVTFYVGEHLNLNGLIAQLKSKGILIRLPPKGIQGWIRVGAGTLTQAKTFLEGFIPSLQGAGWRKEEQLI